MSQNDVTLIANRKRCRNQQEEESSEFTPLSKRINNLHINNGILALHKSSIDHTKQVENDSLRLAQLAQYGMDLRISQSRNVQDNSQYSPDLGPSENPFYYESNKLLFTLYMERLHRTGMNSFYQHSSS
uniref:Uncharacterized protein n=1 Tax=Clastoptera arizonana TaxID=38151 RepID=A0A1B6DI89_9HEMI